jgi:hypothetical protein
MRSRRLASALALTSLTVIAACTAIAGLDGDFSVNSDGGPTGTSTSSSSGSPGVDANVGGMDGSSNDAADSDTPDMGPPDNYVPVDACATRIATEAVGSASPQSGHWCKTSGNQACFDFNAADVSPYNYNREQTNNGGSVSLDPGGSGDNSLQVSLPFAAEADASAALFVYDWNGLTTDWDELPWGVGQTLDITFLFRFSTPPLRAATLTALRVDEQPYGLALYPDPCDPAIARIAQTDEANLEVGAVVHPNIWYLGRFHVARPNNFTWTANAFVGNIAIGSRANMWETGLGNTLDAGLGTGVFNTTAPGQIAVELDDVTLKIQ